MKVQVSALSDIVYALEYEIEALESAQAKCRKNFNRYLQYQDRIIALYECIRVVKESLDAKQKRGAR